MEIEKTVSTCEMRYNFDMDYASKDLAQRFNVTNETIRSWALEFKRQLSEAATPVGGRHRRFSFDDLEVLTLVAEMRGKNNSFEDIHASLDSGERGIPSVDPTALVPLEGQKQLALLHETINKMRGHISDLESQIASEKTRADRAEGSLAYSEKLFRDQLADKEKQIRELYLEVARLKAPKANGRVGDSSTLSSPDSN
jgi:DNA-binding transcriptional MerR regulator